MNKTKKKWRNEKGENMHKSITIEKKNKEKYQ